MTKESQKGTPDQRIAHEAKQWRAVDREAIANKSDREKQRLEYQARKNLRKAVDDARSEP
jgi:hypothetical protein